MPRWLMVLLAVLLAAGVAGWWFRNELVFTAMKMVLEPPQAFADTPRPSAPDYTTGAAWAALPGRADAADVVPAGIPRIDEQQTPVDVFFVHPTTFYSADGWNAPLDDATSNERTDRFVMASQASAFNGCCRVFAPRYRQATLFSFFEESDNSERALDLAYGDVTAAFDHYLQHFSGGRPFILAAHSQGSRHLERLLRDISGTPLTERLVAAYPVGFFIDETAMAAAAPDIPVCASAGQTGCLVSWNAVAPDAPQFSDPSGSICVNPLTWQSDDATAPHSANLGGWGFDNLEDGIEHLPLEPGVADARCTGGVLVVSEVRGEHFDLELTGPGSYHLYDYGLFWTNVYKNAADRVASWLGR